MHLCVQNCADHFRTVCIYELFESTSTIVWVKGTNNRCTVYTQCERGIHIQTANKYGCQCRYVEGIADALTARYYSLISFSFGWGSLIKLHSALVLWNGDMLMIYDLWLLIQGKRPPLCMILEPTRHGSRWWIVWMVMWLLEVLARLRFQGWISGGDGFKVLVVDKAVNCCDIVSWCMYRDTL